MQVSRLRVLPPRSALRLRSTAESANRERHQRSSRATYRYDCDVPNYQVQRLEVWTVEFQHSYAGETGHGSLCQPGGNGIHSQPPAEEPPRGKARRQSVNQARR